MADLVMHKLSPATKSVVLAFTNDPEWMKICEEERISLAAALRAVADIVTPVDYEDIWTDGRMLQYEKQDPIRDKLLSIANELESIQ